MSQRERVQAFPVYAALFAGIVIGLAIGGILFWRGFNLGLGHDQTSFSYADLSAMLLTVVAIIIAVFGSLIAIFGFFGYRNMDNSVRLVAKDTALKALDGSLEEGGELHAAILERVSLETEFGRAFVDKVHELYLKSISADTDEDFPEDDVELDQEPEE